MKRWCLQTSPLSAAAVRVARTGRRIAFWGGMLIASFYGALWTVGFRPFSDPPQVGKDADAIVIRLGPPSFDSREGGDGLDDYRLGYTDNIGMRYHLHVVAGLVAEIERSSR